LLRVLFVDDEPKLLEGLRRSLRAKREVWDMRFEGGGEAALRAIDEGPFDVVVTDMRMPGIDGATLLGEIHARCPGTIRMVLSGQTSPEDVLRAVPAAHRFLAKPCETRTLIAAVDRVESVRSRLPSEALRALVGGVASLPIAARLREALFEALRAGTSSPTQIARLLERDPGVSAKVLQLVHSAFFGTARRAIGVADAVAFLGTGTIETVARSLPVSEATALHEKIAQDGVGVARICAALAEGCEPAAAFTAGLLHDVGRLAILAQAREVAERIDAVADGGGSIAAAERETFGASHADLGAYLLGVWGFPLDVVEAVRHHHGPSRSESASLDLVGALHLASELVHGDPAVEELDHVYLARAGFVDRLPELRARAAAALAA